MLGVATPKLISTPKGTEGLEAPASDPVLCNKTYVSMVNKTCALIHAKKTLINFGVNLMLFTFATNW